MNYKNAFGLIGYGRDASVSGINLANNCLISINDTFNCAVSMNEIYVGGLIGYNYFSDRDSLIISNCTSECVIDCSCNNLLCIGGLIGSAETPVLKFSNCENSGMITGNSDKTLAFDCFIGGITAVCPHADFINCRNYGDLTANSYYDGYAAGLIAKRAGSDFDTVSVIGCSNRGKIMSSSHKYGSISGGLIATVFPRNCLIDIKNCENSGVIITKSYSSTGYVAGLIAWGTSVTIEKSINKGIISGHSDPQFPEQLKFTKIFSGGLVGYAVNGDIIIKNCGNVGPVSGSAASHASYVGGFAGGIDNYFGNPVTISNSYNAGVIYTDSAALASGIIKYHPDLTPAYSNVYTRENPVTADSGNTWLAETEGSLVPESGFPESETTAFMQTRDFVDLLNSNQTEAPWMQDSVPNLNFGYPILKNEISAVKEINLSDDVIIYPNPAENFIDIINSDELQPVSSVCIYNISGNLETESKGNTKRIDISMLPPGIHFIKIYYDNKIINCRFIKK